MTARRRIAYTALALTSIAVLGLGLVLSFRTWDRFVTFGLRRDIAPFEVDLRGAAELETASLLRRARVLLRATPERPARALHLHVAPDRLAMLDAELPYSGRREVEAVLETAGTLRRVDLRYRGDTYAHWGDPKKSFRVQTHRAELFEGMRTFHLLAPKRAEQLNNHLGYRLADHLGLLAPRSELARLFVNGSYRGLRILVEDVDESFLRHRDRAPGDIHRGELLLRDAWTGIPNDLFTHAPLWAKAAVDNRRPTDDHRALAALLDLLRRPRDAAVLAELATRVDLEAFARLSVFEQLTQSRHNDLFHNWRLYRDPLRGRFEPILWDPVAWIEELQPAPGAAYELEPVFTPLHDLLHDHAGFLAARVRILREFVDDGGRSGFLAELATSIQDTRDAVPADPDLRPLDEAQVAAALVRFEADVRRALDEVPAAVLHAPPGVRWHAQDDRLVVELAGAGSVDGLVVECDAPPTPQAIRLVVRRPAADGEDREEVHAVTDWSVEGRALRVPIRLVAERATRLVIGPANTRHPRRRVPIPTTFALEFDGLERSRVEALRVLDGAPGRRDDALRLRPVRALFGLETPPESEPETWRGVVEIGTTRVLDRPLRIEAGTVVRLAPGTSLVLHDRLVADGSVTAPITFERLDAAAAWGGVVLHGPRADGSRLVHCRFRGGSEPRDQQVDYTGMLAIHEVGEVTLRDCEFTEPGASDDVVHAACSRVVGEAVTIRGAAMDGLDADFSDLVLRDCRFVDCGNDGLDLMGSRARISRCDFVGCGDKGLSIGERSLALLTGSRIRGCTVGVEVRDGSAAALAQVTVQACDLAVHATRKNWRYAGRGGAVHACRSWLDGGAVVRDPASAITLFDCRVTGLAVRPDAGPTLRSCSEQPAAEADFPAAPPWLEPLGATVPRVWAASRRDLRGAD